MPVWPICFCDLLADAAHVEHAPGREDLDVEDGHAGVVERVERRLRGKVDDVLVGVAADLGHRGAEHPDGFTHWSPSFCRFSESSDGLEAEHDGFGAFVVGTGDERRQLHLHSERDVLRGRARR